MNSGLTIRRGNREDAEACGRIAHDAFADIAGRHGFEKDFPSVEAATGALSAKFANPHIYSIVAEQDGRIVGSNFLDERSVIASVGPVSVDPSAQNGRVGLKMMGAALQRAQEMNFAGVRLLQDAFHNRSFALYSKLGFQMRVTTSVMDGLGRNQPLPGYDLRPATDADVTDCGSLCLRVHGHTRPGELHGAIEAGTAQVVMREGRLTGYSTSISFSGHAVAETTGDLEALISGRLATGRPWFHVPNDNAELLRWCYDNGFRMVKAMTLMTMGLYNVPNGAYLPSVMM
jgi:predicted N-acetyltransferase YhbS